MLPFYLFIFINLIRSPFPVFYFIPIKNILFYFHLFYNFVNFAKSMTSRQHSTIQEFILTYVNPFTCSGVSTFTDGSITVPCRCWPRFTRLKTDTSPPARCEVIDFIVAASHRGKFSTRPPSRVWRRPVVECELTAECNAKPWAITSGRVGRTERFRRHFGNSHTLLHLRGYTATYNVLYVCNILYEYK